MSEQQTDAEATATPVYQAAPCKFCGGPVVAPKRKNLVKEFCCDKHRAAWRDDQLAKSVQNVLASVEEFGAEMERMSAVTRRWTMQLNRLLPKRIRQAAQTGTQSGPKDKKGLDSNSGDP